MLQSLLNHLIITFVPLLPKIFIKIIADRYVAGETNKDVLNIAQKLNKKGYSVTIDILGEHSKSTNEAISIRNKYIELYKSIRLNKLDCHISVKPTHLGLDISKECMYDNFLLLLAASEDNNNFLRIDMESSKVTEETIKLYNTCKKQYSKVV